MDDDKKTNFLAGLLIILAIIIHVVDYMFGFRIDWVSMLVRGFVYIVLSVLAIIFIDEDKQSLAREVAVVSAIPVIIIPLVFWLVSLIGFPDSFSITFRTLAFVIPVWPLYLVFYKQISIFLVSFLVKLYTVIMLLIGLIYVLSVSLQLGALPDETSVPDHYFDVRESVSYFWEDMVKAPIVNTWSSIRDIDYQGAIDRRVNQTLGRDYQGDVIRARDETGIFIDDFRLSSRYATGDDVTFQVPVRVRTFEEDETVSFRFNCTASDGRDTINGTLSDETLTLGNFDSSSVFCTFENVSRGRYTVDFRATFNFSTTGYSVFYFIDSDILMQMHDGSETQAARYFRINTVPFTEYTRSPVSVGMNQSSRLPIPLHSGRDTSFTLSYGVQNANLRFGDVERVNKFELSLPREIVLDSERCTLEFDNVRDAEVPGYRTYTFEPPTRGATLEVGCQAVVSPDNARSLVTSAFNEISEVTILSRAEYEYTLLRRGSMDVR